MKTCWFFSILLAGVVWFSITMSSVSGDEGLAALPKAFVDGTGQGWNELGEADFVNVNCDKDTWTWNDDGVHRTGTPVGVIRSNRPFTNFELVAQGAELAREIHRPSGEWAGGREQKEVGSVFPYFPGVGGGRASGQGKVLGYLWR